MANTLSPEAKDKIRQLFMECGNIKQVTRELRVGKNTVRRLIRSEGLMPAPLKTDSAPLAKMSPPIEEMDFRLLEKLFVRSGETGGPKEFERHIKSMAVEIAGEIGVRGRLDIARLEMAICEYVQYRRFLFCSLDVSDKTYCGPYAKFHDKASKAALKWVEASGRAFDNFNRVCRELEVKYGKRSGHTSNVYVQQNQQINLHSGGGHADATLAKSPAKI